ncbi:MAG: PBECR2 nuclease fold domain-containing protein [Oscillospiraceae bacterium]
MNVQLVGKINIATYRCVSAEIVTDEVVMTEERIEHIRKRHPNDYERFCTYIPRMIAEPDYIVQANKANTAVILKEIEENGEKFKLILRIKMQHDPADYRNSVLSFWRIGDTTWRKTLKNKKILYKAE